MRSLCLLLAAAPLVFGAAAQAGEAIPSQEHPDVSGWSDLFAPDLSNAVYPEGVWTFADGVLTASKDECIWSDKDYDDFILDLEFKNAPETNSGVIVYCSDMKQWIPNSVEIQIADDHSQKWGNAPPTWQCGAAFGRLAAASRTVKEPGQWNRMTITCKGPMICVALNGQLVTELDMRKWTDARKNPDGSDIPAWLSKPLAELPTKGRIGLQGKHAGAPIWFRNVKIHPLD